MTDDFEVRYLMSFDIPEAEACAWATFCAEHGVSLDVPPGWSQEGFSLSEAIPWIDALGLPDERAASYFSKARWIPAEAAALLQVYINQPAVAATRVIDIDSWLEAAGPWVDSGLIPKRICHYTAAGMSLEAARAFERRSAVGEDIEPTLALLAALRTPRIWAG